MSDQVSAPPSFEEAIRRLGELVRKLEEGELPLEESLRAFEQGVSLVREAQHRLDTAEARVDELLGVDDQGRAVTRPIASGESPAPSPPAREARPTRDVAPATTRKSAKPVGDDDDLPF